MSVPIRKIEEAESLRKYKPVGNAKGVIIARACYKTSYWFHVYENDEVFEDVIRCFPKEISQLFGVTHSIKYPITVVATGKVKGIQLAGTTILMLRAQEFFKKEACNLQITGSNDVATMNLCLNYFARFPTFEGYYRLYCANPDTNVSILKSDETGKLDGIVGWIKEVETKNTKRLQSKMTQAEVGLHAHFLILTGYKNFYQGESSTHVEDFSKQRKQAFMRGEKVEMQTMITPAVILAWSNWMQNLPRLRECLFSVVSSSASFYECSLAMELLNYDGMTVIDVVNRFIECSPKTVAHRHPVVLKEIIQFLVHLVPFLTPKRSHHG
ncbi:hypothetical protein QAD02_006674 [Eretmocerus hayati]|uniref:Uncharacterized protein n=1 Tax=Eretmocerus hayati TaxID=131215 RepID=A0ACC2N1L1_9HYME|nr:hypothetical protein QAD02_006674 [Eretmocerus hayati]